MVSAQELTGLILAGGAGRRMDGQDKGLLPLAGRPLVAWVAEALRPQVGSLWISANRHHNDYALYADLVLSDALPDFQGPLAGLAEALNQASTPWLLITTCDAPLIPRDLAQRLASGTATASRPESGHGSTPTGAIHIAVDQAGRHPLHALVPTALRPDLRQYLDQGGRRVQEWMSRHPLIEVPMTDVENAFLNLNEPEQLARLEKHIRQVFRTSPVSAASDDSSSG